MEEFRPLQEFLFIYKHDFQLNLFRNLFHLNSVFFDVFTYSPTDHKSSVFALAIYNDIFDFFTILLLTIHKLDLFLFRLIVIFSH